MENVDIYLFAGYLEYFTAIWYFVVVGIFSPVLVYFTKKNLETLGLCFGLLYQESGNLGAGSYATM
jgi:hypothetical protein